MTAINEGYVFRWKDHANNFSISFKDLLQNKEMVDVTLVADGNLFDAHRLVLAAISPHFRQMFTQVPANQQVFIKNVSKEVLEDLITFIYCGEVKVSEERFEDFLNTAKALEIKGLSDECHEKAIRSRKLKRVFSATKQCQADFGHGSDENVCWNRDNENNSTEMILKRDAPNTKRVKRNCDATENNVVAAIPKDMKRIQFGQKTLNSQPSKLRQSVRIQNLQKFDKTIVIDDEKTNFTIDSEDELFSQDKKSFADDTNKKLSKRMSKEMSPSTRTKQHNEQLEFSIPSTSKQMPFSPKSKFNLKHKNKDAKGQDSNQLKKYLTSPGKPNQEKLLNFNINDLLMKLHK